MTRILEQLYVGNLRPDEEKHEKFDECQQLMDQALKLSKTLSENVSEQEQKSVTTIVDLMEQQNRIDAQERYIQGFKHGMRIAFESVCKGGIPVELNTTV